MIRRIFIFFIVIRICMCYSQPEEDLHTQEVSAEDSYSEGKINLAGSNVYSKDYTEQNFDKTKLSEENKYILVIVDDGDTMMNKDNVKKLITFIKLKSKPNNDKDNPVNKILKMIAKKDPLYYRYPKVRKEKFKSNLNTINEEQTNEDESLSKILRTVEKKDPLHYLSPIRRKEHDKKVEIIMAFLKSNASNTSYDAVTYIHDEVKRMNATSEIKDELRRMVEFVEKTINIHFPLVQNVMRCYKNMIGLVRFKEPLNRNESKLTKEEKEKQHELRIAEIQELLDRCPKCADFIFEEVHKMKRRKIVYDPIRSMVQMLDRPEARFAKANVVRCFYRHAKLAKNFG